MSRVNPPPPLNVNLMLSMTLTFMECPYIGTAFMVIAQFRGHLVRQYVTVHTKRYQRSAKLIYASTVLAVRFHETLFLAHGGWEGP